MFSFLRGGVLVGSSCAGMGMDVSTVRLVVNIGMPLSEWVLQQQDGRAGRDGLQSVCVNLGPKVRNTIPGPAGMTLLTPHSSSLLTLHS